MPLRSAQVAARSALRRRTAAAEDSPEEAALLDAPLEDAVADAETGEHTPVAEEGFSLDEIAFETASEGLAPDADDVPGADLDAEGAAPIAEARPDNVVSIFDADEGEPLASEGDDPMSDLMSDLPTDPEAGMIVTPPPAVGAEEMGGEVARMMEGMERRMSQLEARLDEATEAREKLERQVAAQAEELRVQRAAIARTQRALRGMNRSAAPETPSEPVLRDSTQVTG